MKYKIFEVIFIIFAIYLTIIIFRDSKERHDYINKHTCAVWGYAEDCKTPLSPEKRLK